MNLQTFLLAAVVFAAVATIVASEIRKRKKGGCSGCSGCSGACGCHGKK